MSAAEKAVAADAASAATTANTAAAISAACSSATSDPAGSSGPGMLITPGSIVPNGSSEPEATLLRPDVSDASSPAASAPGVVTTAIASRADAAVRGPLPMSAGSGVSGRCAGIEYANWKKEEAREQYKDKRRKELLQMGELERVKRREKNDQSMSRGEKYSRRLKMNQDSAAAARAAQEAYIKALEGLVETGEEERNMMDLEAVTLRVEREQLVQRLNGLHHDAEKALLEVDPNHVTKLPETVVADGTDSLRLLQKMMEVYEGDGGSTALTDEADFARGLMGLMPAPAV